MRAVTGPGRWVWGLSGLVTAAALVFPGTRLLVGSAGHVWHVTPTQDTVTRTVTVPQPVVSLTVQSYDAPVQVTTGPARRVQVTETLMYDHQAGGPPAVTQSVSGGRLTLADPACATSDCSVSFAVTIPPGVTVTVTSQGGPVTVSGTAGANLDSGGGPVSATRIGGPLTVSTGGGPLQVNGLAGGLRADTWGGDLVAHGVAAATATVSTGGGQALIAFSAAPDTVTVSSDGGPVQLTVPGGPYALTADGDGGPQWVGIATDPAASRSITVFSGGGPLRFEP
jgi:hypothetical protein